jgi:hypothetical protein
VHQQGKSPVVSLEVGRDHLPDAAHARDARAVQRGQRRVERLQGRHAGRQRRLDLGALERGAQAPGGDLDLGQLRHADRM